MTNSNCESRTFRDKSIENESDSNCYVRLASFNRHQAIAITVYYDILFAFKLCGPNYSYVRSLELHKFETDL